MTIRYQIIQLAFFCIMINNLNAQMKFYTASKDTMVSKIKLFDIELGEIDSPKTRSLDDLSPFRDSSYFRGNLIQAFVTLLHTHYAYIKTSGKVPNKYIQYHIYLKHDDKGHSPFHTGTAPYKDAIITALQSFYKCKVQKVEKMTDVFVIYKQDKSKFIAGACPEEDPLACGSPDNITDSTGKKWRYYYIIPFNNEYLGLSHLFTSYLREIILIDEKDVEDTRYNFKFSIDEDVSIDGFRKGLLRHGLTLVKEQRMHEVYQIDFY
jgi:hypothetical protein